MSATLPTPLSTRSWTSWPLDAKQRLLAKLRSELWRQTARAEQLPPAGDWSVWYVRGGRGAGKTRTGAETLAAWIFNYEPGDWAIVAPTFTGDARAKCVEGPSGLLKALGGYPGPLIRNYNRGEGIVTLSNGSNVVTDGADDGAKRIQGWNLRGVWADEVGLWEKWDTAWNESIAQAVRFDPGRIVATGTPKIGHPLIAHLLVADHVAHTHMRTIDNVSNLSERRVSELYAQYGGSTLGRQELEGEFIEALEGSILQRAHWKWFACRSHPVDPKTIKDLLPRFETIVYSWDTAVKGKASNDPVAGQAWGIAGPDRYLLRLWHGQASFDATIVHMNEMLTWGRDLWPNVAHKVLIETSANGADAIRELRSRVDGIYGYNPRDGGDKPRRALSAAVALETGHCFLPGFADKDPNGKGYRSDTPPEIQAFVEECAMFRGDMKHLHDDQVDAWSQMVNWTRGHGRAAASLGRARGRVPVPGGLAESAARR